MKESRVLVGLIGSWLVLMFSIILVLFSIGSLFGSISSLIYGHSNTFGYGLVVPSMEDGYEQSLTSCLSAPSYPDLNSSTDLNAEAKEKLEQYYKDLDAYNKNYFEVCKQDIENAAKKNGVGNKGQDVINLVESLVWLLVSGTIMSLSYKEIRKKEHQA